ncbi:DUF624 domain-containing protein [bacterium D16-51]|nr:DUF624 domain-containing protein [bacterium D16-59]RKI56995.1 DUF624 domain-containing protein [bacterium D16-51]
MKLNIESPLFEFINTTVHFIALNLLFLITCLPVITAGPAIAALYQVLLKEARGENGYLCSNYLKYFKQMFFQGIAVFAIYVASLFVLVFSTVFWSSLDGILPAAAAAILALLSLIVISGMLYVFPLMARFQNTIRQTVKNSFIIALSNMKLTVLLLLLHITVISLLYLIPFMKIFMLMAGFAFFAFCFSYLFTKLFIKYEQEAEN